MSISENQLSEIKGFDADKLPNLQTLELRKNNLKSTKGIRISSLKSLFIVSTFSRQVDFYYKLYHLVSLQGQQ